MQTLVFNLTAGAWTEILGGNNTLAVQLISAANVRLHFNDSATAPAIDAPSILVESFPPRWDFECSSQVGQSHVWARGDNGPAKIAVVRRTA
jgi:hypothetical protein